MDSREKPCPRWVSFRTHRYGVDNVSVFGVRLRILCALKNYRRENTEASLPSAFDTAERLWITLCISQVIHAEKLPMLFFNHFNMLSLLLPLIHTEELPSDRAEKLPELACG